MIIKKISTKFKDLSFLRKQESHHLGSCFHRNNRWIVSFLQKLKFTRTHIVCFSLFSLLFSSLTYSQNSQLQNFTTKEGLPQSQVYDIVQDSIGYLWIATQGGGIARFDGDEFTVFNEKKGLKSNFVNSLLVRNDSVFAGTFSGLSIYSKEKFTNYETPRIYRIVSIDKRILLATEKGLYKIEKDSVVPLKIDAKIDLNIVTDLIKDNYKYFIATKKGLWMLDTLENPTSIQKLDVSDYTSLIKVNDKIIASTFDSGIKVISKGKIIESKNAFQRIHRIHFIDNQYWVASDSKGVFRLDTDFNLVQSINEDNGLIVNQIHSILKDKQDNIWIGSSGGGLYKLTQNNFKHYDRDSGLKGNRIYAVHHTGSEIWISNSEKGLMRIDSLGIIYPIEEDNGFLNVKSKTIATDQWNNVWVGTERKGILIFKKEFIQDSVSSESKFNKLDKNLFPNYTLVTDTINIDDGLTSNWVKKIKIDRSAWVATYSSGIIELPFDIKSGELTGEKIYYGTKKGIKDLLINDLEIDSNGSIWYATKSGNLGFINNRQVRDFYQVLGKEIAISTILIKDKNIYLGTLGDGIWVANASNPKEVQQLKGVKNLNSNNIYQLVFDDENNLWAGTEKGVNKIVLDENNAINDVFYFNRSDGFLGIETCQNAVDKDSKGNIWFGTMNGLTQYIPSNNQQKKTKPSITFETLKVVYQPVDSINLNNYDKVLHLKPNENHLSLQFKSIDINHPKGIEYRWKLIEHRSKTTSEFSPWSAKDFIEFPNLNNGTYEFIVQARNIDWVESDPISFQFFIEAPLHEKPWFLWTIYSSLGGIVLLILFISIKRIKRKNKQKIAQLALENHLLSLEQKALQLQMNPHFIFNVLNGIKSMGAEGEKEKMNTTINTFASLLRSILNSSREEEIALKEEIATLQNYLILEQQMSPDLFQYEIDVDTKGVDAEEILIPPMLIQPFVENSIKHGFQQLGKQGKITIRFIVQGEYLFCEIRDNGIGIKKAKQQKKTHHQSAALQVTKERIERLSGENTLKIKEDQGTIVSFRLPLKTDF